MVETGHGAGQAFMNHGRCNYHEFSILLPLTARQYGEVVLLDASIRAGSRYFSQKAVTVQGGYGALFAVQGTEFYGIYELRGTELSRS